MGAYLFLLPAGIVLLVFFFVPFFHTIFLSFFDYSSDIYHPNFVFLKNYIDLISSPLFLKTILNTFYFLILCVPFLVIFPLFLAILINQKIVCKTLYKLLIYIPVVISIVVVAIAFKWLYAPNGLLNYFLELLNIDSIGWLSDTKYSMISVKRGKAEFIQYHCNSIGDIAMGF